MIWLPSKICVILVTFDKDLFQRIGGEIACSPGEPHVVLISDPVDIDLNIMKGAQNFAVIDVDTAGVTYPFLNSLCERHNIKIILTAAATTKAIPLIRGQIRDFVIKPSGISMIKTYANSVLFKIKNYRDAAPTPLRYTEAGKTVDENTTIIAIGSSTGGTMALEAILKNVPAMSPPILIVQHIISGFTSFFADRLNTICQVTVKEAKNNDYVQRGTVLIAPADYHMVLVKKNQKLMVECYKGEKVNCVMPSVDVLFDSVAAVMRRNAVGVILTGMGADGARGLLKMRAAGAKTIGQDKETSVVYGMPKVAYDMGAVATQLPLNEISAAMLRSAGR